MTKRRAHWDTELEQSVSAILFDCYNNGVSEEQVYQAIAAVEGWQCDEHEQAMRELRGWQDAAASYRLRAEKAEAAIARVRKWHAEHCDECNDTGPCPTIRALEGGSDE